MGVASTRITYCLILWGCAFTPRPWRPIDTLKERLEKRKCAASSQPASQPLRSQLCYWIPRGLSKHFCRFLALLCLAGLSPSNDSRWGDCHGLGRVCRWKCRRSFARDHVPGLGSIDWHRSTLSHSALSPAQCGLAPSFFGYAGPGQFVRRRRTEIRPANEKLEAREFCMPHADQPAPYQIDERQYISFHLPTYVHTYAVLTPDMPQRQSSTVGRDQDTPQKPSSSSSSPTEPSSGWYSNIFSIPAPVKMLFDKVPMVVYAPNELPQRAPRSARVPSLYVFSTVTDAAAGMPSFNPSCLKWQVCVSYEVCEACV